MRKISGVTDFFVICSGTSSRQVKAISDHISEKIEQSGQKVSHIEGYHHALWVLLDCAGVIVHVFQSSMREFYDLERLWSDAPLIPFEKDEKRKKT